MQVQEHIIGTIAMISPGCVATYLVLYHSISMSQCIMSQGTAFIYITASYPGRPLNLFNIWVYIYTRMIYGIQSVKVHVFNLGSLRPDSTQITEISANNHCSMTIGETLPHILSLRCMACRSIVSCSATNY